MVVFVALLLACGRPPGASPDGPDGPGTPGSDGPAAPSDGAPPIVDPDAADPDGPGPDAPPLPFKDPFVELRALPGTCTADNWCWRYPTPHGNDYVRVFATAPDNLWLTARQGTVMQWNGYTWRFHTPQVPAGQLASNQFPAAIGGLDPTNMWLVFGATLQQWDGQAWTIRDTGQFNSIWVSPDGDAWVTGNAGIKRWHQGVAQNITPCGCFVGSIWGTSAEEVFVTTLPPGILRFDGQAWTQSYSGSAIAGSYLGVTKDVWVGGADGALLHWDGATWTTHTPPLQHASSRTILGAGYFARDDVWWWVTGEGFLHWNGTALERIDVDFNQDGGLAPFNSATIVDGTWWLVGNAGAVYTRKNGDLSGEVKPRMRGLLGMWGSAEDSMYFLFGGRVEHWDGTGFTSMPANIQRLGGIRANGVDELFGGGDERTPDLTQFILTGWHHDGTAWHRTPLETAGLDHRSFLHVYGIASGEAIAVGTRGVAYFLSNGTWKPIATGTTNDLYGSWGPDPDHVWIVGRGGTFLRWDRANPGVATPDPGITTTADLGPIHGANGTAWIARAQGAKVLRNSGAGWQELPAVTVGSAETGGIFAVDDGNVVVSSSGQALLARWNGTAFVREEVGWGSRRASCSSRPAARCSPAG
ncbi:MAG: hypothetical protein KIT31_31485 [Deltaproteobacteria bacterium]|nr:hypothetical protein [Deltaproteobacteria bacterium]